MKPIFENERVRVVQVRIPPGAKTEMHTHPTYLTYALTPATARVIFPDGSSRQVERKQGEVFFFERVTHVVENIGADTMMSLDIELK